MTLNPMIRPDLLPEVTRTPTSLEMPEEMTFEEWRDLGLPLLAVGQSVMWWVGDWLRYGERNYGHLFTAAAEWTGLEYSTLANALWVTKHVAPERRRPGLTFTHHAEVAVLEPEEQDRLLAEAEAEQWASRQLRAEVRRITATDASADTGTTTTIIRIVTQQDDVQQVREAVERSAGALAAWCSERGIKADIAIDSCRR